MNTKKYYLKNPQTFFYIIIFTGIFLAIFQFIYNRSLWIDEAFLALNIINKGFAGLIEPLDYRQVAPIGFIFIEKTAVLIFGKNEYALRIFPLITFLASIPVFYLVSKKLLKNNLIVLISTSIFSTAYLLINYSSEVKQYSSDVLIALLILYLTLGLKLNKNKSLFIYGVFGSIVIWFSNVSVILLFVSGLYVLYTDAGKNKNYKILLPIFFWAASFFTYYFFFIHNHPTTEYMTTYWKNSFLPLNPFSKAFFIFLLEAAKDMFGYLLGFGPFWVIPLIITTGSIVLLIKQKEKILLYFCLMPILVHLILSGFSLYPFSYRLILYLSPMLIILFSSGLYNIFRLTSSKIIKLPDILLILPVIVMFYPLYIYFPVQKEEIKSSLHYIEKNAKKEDSIYIYHNSKPAFDFYKEIRFINIKNKTIAGSHDKNKGHEYDQKLLNLKGKVWLLFSHVYPFKSAENEETYIVKFLLHQGAQILAAKKFKGSNIYYIDTKKTLDK